MFQVLFRGTEDIVMNRRDINLYSYGMSTLSGEDKL